MAASCSSSCLLRIGNNYNNDQFQLFSYSSKNNGFHLLSSTALKLKPSTKTISIICAAANDNSNNSNSKSLYNAQRPRAFAPSLSQLLRPDSDKANGLVEEISSCHDPILFNKSGAFPDPPLPAKLVVAVDVDEVLGNFISVLNRFIADRFSLNHSVSEYHVYAFYKIWNCSRDEADICVHEFYKTSYFKTGIHPIPGARQVLQKLSRRCNLSE